MGTVKIVYGRYGNARRKRGLSFITVWDNGGEKSREVSFVRYLSFGSSVQ